MAEYVFEQSGVLNSATAGEALAAQVIDAIVNSDVVHVDFSAVERMTPSFSNTFVLRCIDAVGCDVFQNIVVDASAPQHVRDAIQRSIKRYCSGARLSDQVAVL